ncbi:MAG TPA: hypothetical protein VIP06_06410, partial [Nocardioides sp.]
MSSTTTDSVDAPSRSGKVSYWRMLLRDKVATVAAVILCFILLVAVFGPVLLGSEANAQDLTRGNKAPLELDGWLYV